WNQRLSSKTANVVLTTLSSILDLAKRYKYVSANVAREAERLKVATEREGGTVVTRDQVYSSSEVRRLIQATEPETIQRLMIMVPALTGLRISEVLGLTWPCVDLKAGKLEVKFQLADTDKGEPLALQPPKTRSSRRTIPLPVELVKELRVWRLKCPRSEEDFVFCRE